LIVLAVEDREVDKAAKLRLGCLTIRPTIVCAYSFWQAVDGRRAHAHFFSSGVGGAAMRDARPATQRAEGAMGVSFSIMAHPISCGIGR